MADCTREHVEGATFRDPVVTLETVAVETPANLATSQIVTRTMGVGSLVPARQICHVYMPVLDAEEACGCVNVIGAVAHAQRPVVADSRL